MKVPPHRGHGENRTLIAETQEARASGVATQYTRNSDPVSRYVNQHAGRTVRTQVHSALRLARISGASTGGVSGLDWGFSCGSRDASGDSQGLVCRPSHRLLGAHCLFSQTTKIHFLQRLLADSSEVIAYLAKRVWKRLGRGQTLRNAGTHVWTPAKAKVYRVACWLLTVWVQLHRQTLPQSRSAHIQIGALECTRVLASDVEIRPIVFPPPPNAMDSVVPKSPVEGVT